MLHKISRHYFYGRQKVTYNFWLHGSRESVDTVIFLGSAQTGKTPRWVAELAGKGVVVVDGLPHWQAHPSGKDLKRFSATYSRTAYLEVLKTCGKSSLHIIGISQAAPGVVWTAQELPSSVGNIGLAIPLGLTMHYFGDEPFVRLAELKRRVFRGLTRGNILFSLSTRELYVVFMLWRARFAESERGASDNKYAAGLSYDLRPDCQEVFENQKRRNRKITIFLGEGDAIFPPSEVTDSLRRAGLGDIETIIVPGLTHPSFVSPRERANLRSIVDAVRT